MDATHTPEEWRPIPSWEGLYAVSDQGRVRALRSGKICRLTLHTSGHYRVVGLSRPGSRRTSVKHVHKLVLEAFVGPRPKGLVCCHGIGGRGDNRLANLRYDTSSANQYDTVRDGNHHYAKRTHCNNGHEFTPENTLARENGGGRRCLTCKREWGRIAARRQYAKRKAKENSL